MNESEIALIRASILKILVDADTNILNELIRTMDMSISFIVNEPKTPVQLEWVLKEATIQRYNRLGSEGLLSENIDVIGMTYIEDILANYQSYFNIYMGRKTIPQIIMPIRFL